MLAASVSPLIIESQTKSSRDRGQVCFSALRTQAELSHLAITGQFRQRVSMLRLALGFVWLLNVVEAL